MQRNFTVKIQFLGSAAGGDKDDKDDKDSRDEEDWSLKSLSSLHLAGRHPRRFS